MKVKALVLGSSRGIGNAIVRNLSARGIETVAGLRKMDDKEKYFPGGLEGVTFSPVEASDTHQIAAALNGCTHLFYCINVPYPEWYTKLETLLKASVDACIATGAKLVFPGNVYVYGKPQFNPVTEAHPHAAHTRKGKIRIRMEELLFQSHKKRGLQYTVVRMPDFYGPYVINGVTEKLFTSALTGKKMQWYGSLKVPYEMIFIEDGAQAMVDAGIAAHTNGFSLNVPGYAATTPAEILKEVSKQGGRKSGYTTISNGFLISMAGLFDKMAYEFGEMFYLRKEKLILSGELYRYMMGSLPATPYEAGIAKTLAWAKAFYRL